MIDRLYALGVPTEPAEWVGWGLSMATILAGASLFAGWPWYTAAVLLSLSLTIRLAAAFLVEDRLARFGLHLASWLLFWRTFMHKEPWLLALLVPALFALVSIYHEERRRQEREG